jgi:hypothetical protein
MRASRQTIVATYIVQLSNSRAGGDDSVDSLLNLPKTGEINLELI